MNETQCTCVKNCETELHALAVKNFLTSRVLGRKIILLAFSLIMFPVLGFFMVFLLLFCSSWFLVGLGKITDSLEEVVSSGLNLVNLFMGDFRNKLSLVDSILDDFLDLLLESGISGSGVVASFLLDFGSLLLDIGCSSVKGFS